MALSELVSEAERYLEDHVGAVKDLVQLVPRIEQLVADVERVIAEVHPKPPVATTATTGPEPTEEAKPPAPETPAPETPGSGALPWQT